MTGSQPIRLAAVLVLTGLLLSLPGARVLAAPPNDNFVGATVFNTLPFSDAVDITDATIEPGESFFCFFSPQTVWYAFTAGTASAVRLDAAGSSFSDTVITVYRSDGPGLEGLSALNCAGFGEPVVFLAEAGKTYYIQAGSIFSGGGVLQLNAQAIPPPANDNFADAIVVPGLPFNHLADTTSASTESGESVPSCATFDDLRGGTVWYAFTPAATQLLSAGSEPVFFSPFVAVYTGGSLSSLSEVACRAFGGLLTFLAEAGTTYYFQTGGLFGLRGELGFTLDVTPPPQAAFGFQPFDPSVFEPVQFFDQSFDPGDVGIETRSWDLGDGTTADGCCPSHRYSTDGDYTVQLTVTTFDGRTGSTTQVVPVRTHDVAITKFSVPNAAKAGQTRGIVVGINSRRYPETVQVNLYKGLPGGGFELVGSLTQFVPVRPSNRTTNFKFSYTFTPADAAIGKVTFKATAHILDARDALPADNEAIAPPTKVSP